MNQPVLNRKDFVSDQEVKWCQGCGDFNVLKTMQSVLAKTGKTKHNTVFVSGIGCSSRFPYYMDTYGFHTIHGRAPTIATGVKTVNPELDVWVVTGDGDALSIGGNHFIHAIRRNQDIKILLFNNEIYGLTKGQYSPTSAQGCVSKSTPTGSVDYPLRPLTVAAAANASFIARTSDNDPKHMTAVFEAAASHKGCAVIEILQNCVIFNDKVHDPYNGPKQRKDNLLYLEDKQPMLFGKDKALKLSGLTPTVTDGNDDAVLVHDTNTSDTSLAYMLANLSYPDYPVPVGIFHQSHRTTYDQLIHNHQPKAKVTKSQVMELLEKNSYVL
ncbi:2-oxoacid:ferredoxin oxidoreductase subunit beta [Vibrio sp. S4M6]|uniref:2-oxoacid:ferredoxin oxidoreductase subunit beta n=1 Tax=Vibrio sinus TaxID=2946865 RepID=UPI00202A4D64|nr:2-oxoacid:ferredoxin oxidoreductase subunit beta [Vibrio sinus]MCL9779823.1 2-oxoacid:ferredoxin oxidoreductase subunit beta [Vibrio sinus]